MDHRRSEPHFCLLPDRHTVVGAAHERPPHLPNKRSVMSSRNPFRVKHPLVVLAIFELSCGGLRDPSEARIIYVEDSVMAATSRARATLPALLWLFLAEPAQSVEYAVDGWTLGTVATATSLQSYTCKPHTAFVQ